MRVNPMLCVHPNYYYYYYNYSGYSVVPAIRTFGLILIPREIILIIIKTHRVHLLASLLQLVGSTREFRRFEYRKLEG